MIMNLPTQPLYANLGGMTPYDLIENQILKVCLLPTECTPEENKIYRSARHLIIAFYWRMHENEFSQPSGHPLTLLYLKKMITKFIRRPERCKQYLEGNTFPEYYYKPFLESSFADQLQYSRAINWFFEKWTPEIYRQTSKIRLTNRGS